MRARFRTLASVAAVAGLLFTACGDDDSGSDDDAALTDDGGSSDAPVDGDEMNGGDDGTVDPPVGGDDASSVTITVDGEVHDVTTVQTCETETDTDRETDVTMFGFSADGPRVEFTLSYQGADTSPTGTDQYFGRVSIRGGEVSASVTQDEPFDFLTDDRSTVQGTLTMETTTEPIRPVEVTVDITC